MKRILFFFAALLLAAIRLHAQGCSDAGFCTLGPLQSGAAHDDRADAPNRLTVGGSFGIGDDDNSIVTPYLVYTRTLTPSIQLTSKLTAAYIDGPKGSHFGAGDWYVAGNFLLNPAREDGRLALVAGVKIPLSNPDADHEGAVLPLSYQSSLGTFDGIAGLTYSIRGFELSAAVQVPVVQNNKNTFFASGADTTVFSSTNAFSRRPDALLKAAYRYTTKDLKWGFTAGLLPILHLGDDTYENPSGDEITLDNSAGLTLNGLLNVDYYVNRRQSLQLSLAAPFVVRDIRPDGLTRKFVAALEYNFVF